jgi:hypothetical protein
MNSATWMLKGLTAAPVTQKLLILIKPHGIAYVEHYPHKKLQNSELLTRD